MRAGGRDSVPGSADEAGAAAAEDRPLLFSIAYGMTGSVGDAEGIVQDAFLGPTRARQAGTTITDPNAYLTTAVTRLGINYLSAARVPRAGARWMSCSACPRPTWRSTGTEAARRRWPGSRWPGGSR